SSKMLPGPDSRPKNFDSPGLEMHVRVRVTERLHRESAVTHPGKPRVMHSEMFCNRGGNPRKPNRRYGQEHDKDANERNYPDKHLLQSRFGSHRVANAVADSSIVRNRADGIRGAK